ncbi:MAG TPA: hypothetical protein VI389_11975 [Geobacteraceae bacterium]
MAAWQRKRHPGKGSFRLLCRAILAAVVLLAPVAALAAEKGPVPKKSGIYLLEEGKLASLLDAQPGWKLQTPEDPVVVLSSLRLKAAPAALITFGSYDAKDVALYRLKPSVYDKGALIGGKFNTYSWVEDKKIELDAAPMAKKNMVRYTPKDKLDDGVYAVVLAGRGAKYSFGVGDLEAYFKAIQVDPLYYVTVNEKQRKRFSAAGTNLKEHFTTRFLFTKEGEFTPHPTAPELKIGVAATKAGTVKGVPVTITTLNVVKKMAMVDVSTMTGGGISFPANIEGCYFEQISQKALAGKGNEYGFLIHCPK